MYCYFKNLLINKSVSLWKNCSNEILLLTHLKNVFTYILLYPLAIYIFTRSNINRHENYATAFLAYPLHFLSKVYFYLNFLKPGTLTYDLNAPFTFSFKRIKYLLPFTYKSITTSLISRLNKIPCRYYKYT